MNKIEEIALKTKSVYPPQEVKRYIIPLINKILQKHTKNKTLIVGIQGGQGTGKTTLSEFLKEVLVKLGYSVHAFSIDDFYTPDKERHNLAKKFPTNPFYQIPRGLPGTHRVDFLLKTLRKLKAGEKIQLPIFDKSLHHSHGEVSFKTIKVNEKQDFVLFEGWCVGLPIVSSSELVKICEKNKINIKNLDPQGKYSKVVLNFTKKYQPLWNYINYFIMFKPTSSEIHKQWRLQQEKELQKKTGRGMSQSEVNHFVDVYLPFTYVCYEKIKADTTILLNEKHRIYGMR